MDTIPDDESQESSTIWTSITWIKKLLPAFITKSNEKSITSYNSNTNYEDNELLPTEEPDLPLCETLYEDETSLLIPNRELVIGENRLVISLGQLKIIKKRNYCRGFIIGLLFGFLLLIVTVAIFLIFFFIKR